ncbi:hypothetical protein NM208_g8646 [Fusarium decemcellulare]|uniref:Uncharacterized protein n=1 Tax=Fusarium decemcellulare TaxID=57161 RepID=A0ACC1S4K4_9HYPO|nr:hypothetical protein NM208_g8646 [Fusarium decemcellulare]
MAQAQGQTKTRDEVLNDLRRTARGRLDLDIIDNMAPDDAITPLGLLALDRDEKRLEEYLDRNMDMDDGSLTDVEYAGRTEQGKAEARERRYKARLARVEEAEWLKTSTDAPDQYLDEMPDVQV